MREHSLKLFIFTAAALLLGSAMFPLLAKGTECEDPCTEEISGVCVPTADCTGLPGVDDSDPVWHTIDIVLKFILSAAGILAMTVIVVGGLMYILSGGEPEKAKTAKKIIINGVIGLVVVLLAFAIVTTIFDIFLNDAVF